MKIYFSVFEHSPSLPLINAIFLCVTSTNSPLSPADNEITVADKHISDDRKLLSQIVCKGETKYILDGLVC